MEEPARRNLIGSLVAAGTTLLGVSIMLALTPWLDDNAPTLLLVLVLLASSWFGAWPTFVATVLCVLSADWFFLEPHDSFAVQRSSDQLRLLAFILIGGLLGVFGELRLRQLYRSERKQRFLANLAGATQALSDPDEIISLTARMLAEHLNVNRCAYSTIEDERVFVVHGDYCRGVPSSVGNWPVAAFGPECERMMLANQPFVVNDSENDPRIGPEHRPAYQAMEVRAGICLPLHKKGRFTAAMAVHQAAPRRWTAEEIGLMQIVVGRCWEALERASTARRLRVSEARKTAMINTALDAIITIDHRDHILEFNHAAEAMFGYRQEEVLGQELAALVIPEEMRERHRQGLARRLKTGEGCFLNRHLELQALHRDGRLFPIELSITLIDTVDPPLFTGFIRDITSRKRAEHALRESEEMFRTLADNISAFAWMADPNGQVFWFNQRWFDYTGLGPEQTPGDMKAVIHPDHAARVVKRFLHSIATGEPWEDTFPLRGRDGSYRWFLSRALPIRGEQGRIERWFGTDTDITAQREMQEELSRGAASLADADRRKDEFLATLAHELRNPLAPIRTGLSVMKLAGDDMATISVVRDTLERQTEQLITLVDDLIDVSRITRGRLELRKKRVPLADVVRNAVETSRPLIDLAGHRLEVRLPAIEVELCCDPNRMAQVLSNLLNNACRYTPNGGDIALEARLGDGELEISVRDSGIGIPASRREEIFEMFCQIGSQMGGGRGLGVGLPLARSLTQMHGGSLEVHSEGENQGSEFIVKLPLPRAMESGSGCEKASGDSAAEVPP